MQNILISTRYSIFSSTHLAQKINKKINQFSSRFTDLETVQVSYTFERKGFIPALIVSWSSYSNAPTVGLCDIKKHLIPLMIYIIYNPICGWIGYIGPIYRWWVILVSLLTILFTIITQKQNRGQDGQSKMRVSCCLLCTTQCHHSLLT